jgi:hypothetical protein
MVSISPINPTGSVPSEYPDTELHPSDTPSEMLIPESPTPHKHQLHVLIIGTDTIFARADL